MVLSVLEEQLSVFEFTHLSEEETKFFEVPFVDRDRIDLLYELLETWVELLLLMELYELEVHLVKLVNDHFMLGVLDCNAVCHLFLAVVQVFAQILKFYVKCMDVLVLELLLEAVVNCVVWVEVKLKANFDILFLFFLEEFVELKGVLGLLEARIGDLPLAFVTLVRHDFLWLLFGIRIAFKAELVPDFVMDKELAKSIVFFLVNNILDLSQMDSKHQVKVHCQSLSDVVPLLRLETAVSLD